MISKDKTYCTRNGLEVRIYATDGFGDSPVHGAIKRQGDWDCICWTVDGVCVFNPSWSLIEVKPRHKRTVWLNLYRDGYDYCGGYPSKEIADGLALGSRTACIKVDLDFEEGEGITNPTYSVSSGGSPPFDNGGGFTIPKRMKITEEGL